MPQKIKVNVTQHDIDKGVRCEPQYCPVARAIRRAKFFKGRDAVAGTRLVQYDDDNGMRQGIMLPDVVRRWIEEFDLGHTMSPISFDLEVGV